MSRFRLFGRQAGATAPAPWTDSGSPWTSLGTGGGPATAGARPAQPDWASPSEPATDPYGFPAVPAAVAAAVPAASVPAAAVPAAAVPAQVGPLDASAAPAFGQLVGGMDALETTRDPWPGTGPSATWADAPAESVAAPAWASTVWAGARTGPDPAEAGALAAAFAADYLSWDQDDPSRRSLVLAEYLPGEPVTSSGLGWSGHGRQRADISLPGQVRPDGDDRVLVDVRVRVTPYRRVGGPVDSPVPAPPDVPGSPAAAPPPTARGWRGLGSYWIRLSVPVALDGGRLVVDVDEETLDDPLEAGLPEPAAAPVAATDDPTLDDDSSATGGDR